jgi:hypothetical protein
VRLTGGPFLIDHDQKLQAQGGVRWDVGASGSVGFDLSRHHVPVSVQADLLNAFDTEGVYNIFSMFGGTHVIPPRTLSVRARYTFGRKS